MLRCGHRVGTHHDIQSIEIDEIEIDGSPPYFYLEMGIDEHPVLERTWLVRTLDCIVLLHLDKVLDFSPYREIPEP